MIPMPDSLLRHVIITILGASFFGFSSATAVYAQHVQEQEPQTAVGLESVELRIQTAYQQIAPAVVRITYGTRNNCEWNL